MNRIKTLLRYDLPLHFILLATNWLPDNVFFLRLRGFLCRPFFGSCGRQVNIGRNVNFYNPANIHLGDYVHIAYGCFLLAVDHIWVDKEVMFGPYCVLVSGNHTRFEGSYRFGADKLSPIHIHQGCWLGSHVTVTAGCVVGQGSLLAAGAVVISDIPQNTMAGGVPAREIKKIT